MKYSLQTDDDLGWSQAIGSEDADNIGWDAAEYATDIERVYFRSERQSLRRLPITGAVVFTIVCVYQDFLCLFFVIRSLADFI